EPDGRIEQAAVGADLPDSWRWLSGRIVVDQAHAEESCVGAVEHAKAVAARLNFENRPTAAIDQNDITEELGYPPRVDARVGRIAVQDHTGPDLPPIGEEQLPVCVKQAVLNEELDL